MSHVVGVQSAFPPFRHSQQDAMSFLKRFWPAHEGVLERLGETSGVEHRYLVLPLEKYADLGGFEQRNTIYIKAMLEVLESAIRGLREKVAFDWKDVAAIVSTTITGVAVPSLDARIMNRLPIPRSVVRIPLFGLGCLGGVASLNRAHDWLQAHPGRLALVLAAEACSLTFQFQDASMANLIATSLFGDGAAAVLLAGDEHPLAHTSRLKILDTASSFYPDTERVMGWDMVDTGFKVVLSGNVPDIVRRFVGDDVRGFLDRRRLRLDEVPNLVSHPGGPKVLHALAEVLEKPEAAFAKSWESLRERGNLSSVSVLDVLERSLEAPPTSGGVIPGYGLMLALGPAFNSELTLVEVRA